MPKKYTVPGQKVEYSYPSRFGSHASMVDDCATDERTDDKVVLNDEHGQYITEYGRLDNGMADPNRYNERGLGRLI